jgi:Zn-dependent peptidase ImmA (M78 family)
MNTTQKGENFESIIYDFFKEAIDSGNTPFNKNSCRLRKKPRYYSKDRESDIVFDLAIEVLYPGSLDLFLVTIIECKNYNHPVPINDVEEFYSKIQQVHPARVKAVMATTNSFQSGTLKFAKNKGIGLFRYLSKTESKWELHREYKYLQNTEENSKFIQQKLTIEVSDDHTEDIYCQGIDNFTTSVFDFIADLTKDFFREQELKRIFLAKKPRRKNPIPYLTEFILANKANEILKKIDYKDGAVRLDEILRVEKLNNGLLFKEIPVDGNGLLGRISFNPTQIEVFSSSEESGEGRFRFTIAHELGHYFLNHGIFFKHENLIESSFLAYEEKLQHASSFARLEYQANYFASCLLLPKFAVMEELALVANSLNLRLRGGHIIYIDNQECNRIMLESITSRLARRFKTSKQAVYIKLLNYKLIVDGRKKMLTFHCT